MSWAVSASPLHLAIEFMLMLI